MDEILRAYTIKVAPFLYPLNPFKPLLHVFFPRPRPANPRFLWMIITQPSLPIQVLYIYIHIYYIPYRHIYIFLFQWFSLKRSNVSLVSCTRFRPGVYPLRVSWNNYFGNYTQFRLIAWGARVCHHGGWDIVPSTRAEHIWLCYDSPYSLNNPYTLTRYS